MSSLQQQFEHILMIKDPKSERIIKLETDIYTIDRSLTNNIVIYDRDVSRSHATLVKQYSIKKDKIIFWLIDGHLKRGRSTNGLFVNKKLTISHQLQIGDIIFLAKKTQIKYYRFSHLALLKLSQHNQPLNKETLETLLRKNNESHKTQVN